MEKYLVTGATGYIGSMLIKRLFAEKDVQVTAIVRNPEKARAMLPPDVQLFTADLTDADALSAFDGDYDFLIHCAATTVSREMASHPVEVIDSIVTATRNVCALARRLSVRSMVYLSSMEVYGQLATPDGQRTDETEMGYVDPLSARSCYPMGKRMAENICYSYFSEYGLPVRIARLAQTFGTGVLETDLRVFAQFARSVLAGEDICLHTDGMSVGNYCAIEDAMEAILLLAREGVPGEAYNVVNETCTMTIRELADLAAGFSEDSHVVFDLAAGEGRGYAPPTNLRLSAAKLSALGWKPTKGMKEMFADCLETFREKP